MFPSGKNFEDPSTGGGGEGRGTSLLGESHGRKDSTPQSSVQDCVLGKGIRCARAVGAVEGLHAMGRIGVS